MLGICGSINGVPIFLSRVSAIRTARFFTQYSVIVITLGFWGPMMHLRNLLGSAGPYDTAPPCAPLGSDVGSSDSVDDQDAMQSLSPEMPIYPFSDPGPPTLNPFDIPPGDVGNLSSRCFSQR